ncbi:hypothetical protein ACFRCQ_24655 [Cytobacillus firmus]|uniref:Uncharacterized protein n=1 Tax=Cytobacillus oceanisediminis TaxID=665099 RepID=A0ABX3CKJ5_9BACI|nr:MULTISPECIES: hypothetical protein [Bacillaceae]MBN8202581.1 hypothetical protein [Bacillus sp. NTK034]OHX41405.1 hypothetical protein BBV17_28840 [Cytobacillus oceanisediminis]
MKKKSYLITFSFLICAALLVFNLNMEKGNAGEQDLSEEQLAANKVKELNDRVAAGEEKIIDDSASFPALTEEELYKQSDLIVVGKVKKTVKEYNIHTDIPFSEFEFQVKEYIKLNNEYKDNKLIVTQDGNSEISFDKHPLLESNKDYILFLNVHKEGNETKLIMVGGPNGKFEIENEKVSTYGSLQELKGKELNQFIKESKVKASKQ